MAKNTEIDEKISLEKQLQQDVSGGEGKVLLSVTDTFPFAKWANRFLKSAIIQGAAITLLTVIFVSIQLLFSSTINIVQFLSLSFDGPAKWIFLGYIIYIVLIVAIASTAVFYIHFEVNMLKRMHGFRSMLAWAHLIGMNVGGASITLSMIYAGLVGSGVIEIVLSGGDISELRSNTQIMEEFIIPISISAAILVIGLIAGGLTFLVNYLGNIKNIEYTKHTEHTENVNR
jgi:hypothetical protein